MKLYLRVGYGPEEEESKTAETCLEVDLTTYEPGQRGTEFTHPVVDQKLTFNEQEAEALAALYCLMGFEFGHCMSAIEEVAKQSFLAGFRVGRDQKDPMLASIE